MAGEKLVQSLVKNLIDLGKLDKAVLYGVGEFSRIMIESVPELTFLGILDPDRSEVFDGVKILSYEEIQQLNVEVLILTKQLIGNLPEFRKLLEFCNNSLIIIYDIYGNKINDYINKVEEWEQNLLNVREEEMAAAIDKYDVISFDIFDTLLIRKTFSPEDVFELVQYNAEKSGLTVNNYKEKRIYAQLNSGLVNPNIYEIYDQFQRLYDISDTDKEQLLNLEIKVENQVLIGRDRMVGLFREAIKKNKKIYLISDMYFPKEILNDMLAQNNIVGYCDILVSCDYRQLKLEGLIKICMDITGVDNLLHIGDNIIYDGLCAEMVGADAFLIPSPSFMTSHSKCANMIPKLRNINERNLWGLSQSKFFNSPFFLSDGDGKQIIDNVYDKIYIFAAALITKYMIWFAKRIQTENYQGILFSARDGYLIKELYERMILELSLENMPEGLYFLTSRKAAVMATMDEEAVVNILIGSSFDMKPEDMMHERFGLPLDRILSFDESIYGDSIHAYVWAHKDIIFDLAKQSRCNYFRYMGKKGLKIGEKYAFFDFVSSGTCQKALQKYIPFEIDGFYFGWNSSEPHNELRVESLYALDDGYFMSHYKRIEIFMTSLSGALIGFDDEGEPIFHKEVRLQEELKSIETMQTAIKDYFNEYIMMYLSDHDIDNDLPEDIYSLWEYFCATEKSGGLNGCVLIDDWKNTVEIVR